MKKYTLVAILMCFSLLAKAQTSSGKHHIKYLDINSGNPDTGVSFVNNNQVVFTTTITEKVINTEKYNPYLDFYTGVVGEDGAILEKKRLNLLTDKKISKNAATFTKDGKTVYFSANRYSKRKSKTPRYEIFKATIDEFGNWANIEKLPFNNRKFSYSYPTVNKDHSRIYFISNAAPSYGGTDIFYIDINEDGTYGDPVNLGEKINTNGNETTPFIAENNFLYFSSDGRDDTLGQMDVYAVEAFENTFSDPLHLASPINSINNDVGYIVNTENKGFFSSNRLQGRSNDDIYSFYIEPDKPVECLQEIVGTVRDKETEDLIANATIKVVDEEGNTVHTLNSNESGNYRFTLSCRNTYTVTATKPQYAKEEHIVNTANYFDAPPLEVNQLLEKEIKQISEDKVVVNVNPIYFGFDKYNITKESAKELDKIVKIMKENPALLIEAASHTDSRGPKAYNQKLSDRRARSTVNYIVSKGISKDRITAKGYGESQLINNCKDGVRCGIEKHKLNRRTEFIIVNKQVLNLPTQSNKTQISEKPAKVISTPKVTTAPPKGSVIEGTSNDSSKGEIIFLNEEETIETDKDEKIEEDSNQKSENPKKSISQIDRVNSKKDILKPTLTNKNTVIQNEVASDDDTKLIINNIEESPKSIAKRKIIKEKKEAAEVSEMAPIAIKKRFKRTILADSVDYKKESTITAKISQLSYTTGIANSLPPDRVDKETEVSSTELTSAQTNTKNLHPIEKPTPESDFSVSEQDTSTKNVDAKKETNSSYNRFNRDFSGEENNMSAVSNSLFKDEDDFESYDDKSITANRFATKVKSSGPNMTNFDDSAYYKLQESIVKKQFIESTKNLPKEEVLSVNRIDISPMSVNKSGKYKTTNLAKRVDVMRINFQIDNNKHIQPGYKEVYILIQNPQGTILNRKGSFKMNNGETLTYTEKTNAYYNNNHLNLSMITDRFIQKITKGIYTIIIYIEGYPVGLEMLELN